MVRRAAPVLVLAGGWCAWTVLGARLERPSDNVALLVVALVAMPLAAGIVIALAAGFHDNRPVLVGTAAIGLALAVGGTLTDLPTMAGPRQDPVRRRASGCCSSRCSSGAWHVAVVALLVIGVDTYSVFAGPTKQLLESGDDVVSTFTVPLTAPGMYGAAGIGITDFLFLGLFCGAALHWRLRPRLTLPLCALSFSASVVVAQLLDRSVPALPLLSLAFVLPNIGRLRPSAPDRPWELRTHARDDGELPAQRRRAARPAEPLGVRAGRLLGAARPADRARRDRRDRRRRQLRRPAADPHRRARGTRRPARPRSRPPAAARSPTSRARCARSSRRWRSTPAAATPTASPRRSRPGA